MERRELRAFFGRFAVTHLNSVQLLALLYSLASPEAAALVSENLLEEMGLEKRSGRIRSSCWTSCTVLGFSQPEIDRLVAEAAEIRRQFAASPLRHPTLRAESLAILLETLTFETFLSRASDGVAEALQQHYGLPREAVKWFTLHGEVDVRHAEEGRRVVERFVSWYGFGLEEVNSIARTTFARNVVLQRYFPRKELRAAATRARVDSVEIRPLHIPFDLPFVHAQHHRDGSDTVIVRVRGDGVIGYGETATTAVRHG